MFKIGHKRTDLEEERGWVSRRGMRRVDEGCDMIGCWMIEVSVRLRKDHLFCLIWFFHTLPIGPFSPPALGWVEVGLLVPLKPAARARTLTPPTPPLLLLVVALVEEAVVVLG